MKKITSLALILILILTCLILVACESGGNDIPPDTLSSSDRDKFIGNWSGTYGCESIGIEGGPDSMVISYGEGDLDFIVILHADALNPDTVNGHLTDTNVITIPEQGMGGGIPCTAKITYSNGMLTLSQAGMGITCEGKDYVKDS